MFTGIIAGTGTVLDLAPTNRPGVTRLIIDAGELIADLPDGGSLAVNGVCLTAVPAPGAFAADLMGETLQRTTLGSLGAGSRVNLERCVPAGGRLDGHIVQGHVDAVGAVLAITDQGGWMLMRVCLPAPLAGQVAAKGSIAVDGVSLTVTGVSPADEREPWFEIGLIPATLATTTLGEARVGALVNLETDVVAKYVARLTDVGAAHSAQTGDTA
ncbi:riboflavin synthase [Actinomyces gaoshouyii]|uniref:Riboflavin synthase n=1 Tax=Actinomyces gaoshouyii TaxID=1960083 RepID=A0A8H9H9R5_9ACTO|nr:riboflavin synthase [Actinomyces gaoshouyii]GGO95238.1 riboflavin synthase subunit alpha [Actinomyces gaoshouyii]